MKKSTKPENFASNLFERWRQFLLLFSQGEIYAANCGAEILDNKIPKGLSFIYYLNKNGQSERVKILKL